MSTARSRTFTTTRWTMVAAAGGSSDAAARVALEDLCRLYWPPLYSYLRRQGYDREAAQDLTQGFFAHLLERGDVGAADPTRGRFRTFLLTALKRYAINEYTRGTAIRRGGTLRLLSLDFDQAERTHGIGLGTLDTPERAFDRKWATLSLARAMTTLRAEHVAAGKSATADVLLPYLTDTSELPSYREAAALLGISEGAVKVAVHRLRHRFGTILRRQVSDTLLSPDGADDEIRELIRALAS